jgi:hypothetical protein
MRRSVVFIVMVGLLQSLYGQVMVNSSPSRVENSYLHLQILQIGKDSPPFVWEDHFIVSYTDSDEHRLVGVVFDFENYAMIHPMVRTPNGSYVYYAKLPEMREQIKYRLIVDSVWQADSKNVNYEIDETGVKVSVLAIPVGQRNIDGPIVRPNSGTIDFYLSAASGSQVFLTGNFTNWDPFFYPLTEIDKGFYHIKLPFNPGTYFYSFVVNGRRFNDPANLEKFVLQSTGELVNRIQMPQHN